jgi:hypothetical protein
MVWALVLIPRGVNATSIVIENPGDTMTAPDGVTFSGLNPGDPSTGTGNFGPFVRVQRRGRGPDGLQAGYNTAARAIELDTKTGALGLPLSNLLVLDCVDAAGNPVESGCYAFVLDANEPGGSKREIDITALQVFLGDSDDLTGYSAPFDPTENILAGLVPVYTLDNSTNGDVTVTLSADISEGSGTGGSGKGDLTVMIPVDMIGTDGSKFVYFYTEYERAGGGFEEWAAVIPEPGAGLLLLVGTAGLFLLRSARSRRR